MGHQDFGELAVNLFKISNISTGDHRIWSIDRSYEQSQGLVVFPKSWGAKVVQNHRISKNKWTNGLCHMVFVFQW